MSCSCLEGYFGPTRECSHCGEPHDPRCMTQVHHCQSCDRLLNWFDEAMESGDPHQMEAVELEFYKRTSEKNRKMPGYVPEHYQGRV